MQLASRARSTRETEGVGFEPTVGCPTLDFESSALNRTQPPFLLEIRKRRNPPAPKNFGAARIERNCLRQLGVQRWALDSLPAVALCEGWVERLYWRPFAWISRADW